MFGHKNTPSSASDPSSGRRRSSSTPTSVGRPSFSSRFSSFSQPEKTSLTKRFTKGLSVLIPSSDKEVKKRLRAISSPKMGSLTPNHSTELKCFPPYPLHPSVKDKLDPTYVKFYNKNVMDKQQVHLQPVADSRKDGVLILGGGPQLKVGRIENFSVRRKETRGPDVKCRVFVPEGEPPEEGWPLQNKRWPLMVYYHGGGWVLGNIDTENTVCSHLCARSRCIVVTVDYRLAPENPYPSAVHDSWEGILYLLTDGLQRFNIDPELIAIGGSSAGGNLAAIMTHKLLTHNSQKPQAPLPSFKAQLLIVPVTDNTASIWNNDSWRENEFTPALPAKKMLWYRNHYLPDERQRGHPEASPLFYSDDASGVKGRWAKLPRALVVVGEMDVLRDEGIAYAQRLQKHGVDTKLKIMKGMPHPFLAMDEALQQGRDTISYMVETLKYVFAQKENKTWLVDTRDFEF